MEIIIAFDNVSLAQANILAADMQKYLSINANINSVLGKKNADYQDLGSTLEIILTSTSIINLSLGISKWLARHQERKITIKTKNGTFKGENLSSSDIKNVLEKIIK